MTNIGTPCVTEVRNIYTNPNGPAIDQQQYLTYIEATKQKMLLSNLQLQQQQARTLTQTTPVQPIPNNFIYQPQSQQASQCIYQISPSMQIVPQTTSCVPICYMPQQTQVSIPELFSYTYDPITHITPGQPLFQQNIHSLPLVNYFIALPQSLQASQYYIYQIPPSTQITSYIPSCIPQQTQLLIPQFFPHDPQIQQYATENYEYLRQIQNETDALNLKHQIAIKDLERHCLETILLQDQIKQNPSAFQLHQNVGTITDDLLPQYPPIPKELPNQLQNMDAQELDMEPVNEITNIEINNNDSCKVKKLIIKPDAVVITENREKNIKVQDEVNNVEPIITHIPHHKIDNAIQAKPEHNEHEPDGSCCGNKDMASEAKGSTYPVCYSEKCRSVCCVNNRFNAELIGLSLSQAQCKSSRCRRKPVNMEDRSEIEESEMEELRKAEKQPTPSVKIIVNKETKSERRRSSLKNAQTPSMNKGRKPSIDFHPELVTEQAWITIPGELMEFDDEDDDSEENKTLDIRNSIQVMKAHNKVHCDKDICASTLCEHECNEHCTERDSDSCEDLSSGEDSYCHRMSLNLYSKKIIEEVDSEEGEHEAEKS